MLSSELPIYSVTFELSVALYNYTKQFPRPARIMIGERMVNDSLNMLSCILNANSDLASERLVHLNRFKVLVEELKTLCRFCTETKIISNKQASNLAMLIANVGKQLNGWRRSTADKVAAIKKEKGVIAKIEKEDIPYDGYRHEINDLEEFSLEEMPPLPKNFGKNV